MIGALIYAAYLLLPRIFAVLTSLVQRDDDEERKTQEKALSASSMSEKAMTYFEVGINYV